VGTQLVVRQGTVVLVAVPGDFATPPKPAAPSTRFYVLRDDVALFGDAITSPEASTDAGGDPDLEFDFTPPAATRFTRVTAAIAERGAAVSRPSVKLFQHFAVALDDVLLSVPEIDFDAYPDGIPAGQGAEITDGFTAASARDLALELRLGELPVDLVFVLKRQAP
jgi:SecD/SecF fusion protein